MFFQNESEASQMLAPIKYDNRGHIVVPTISRERTWAPLPRPWYAYNRQSGFIHRFVMTAHDPGETRDELVERMAATTLAANLRLYANWVHLSTRVVRMRHSRLLAIEVVYAIEDTSSHEYHVASQRRTYGGMTFAEYREANGIRRRAA